MQNGQTALSIAQRLGYISVVETLKVVTEQEVTTTTTTTVEEKYRVNAPESMQETFMSDSEDEGGKSVCRKGVRYPPLSLKISIAIRGKILSSKKIPRCSGFDPLEPEGGHGEDDSQAQPILIPGMPYKEVKPYQVWDGPDEARSQDGRLGHCAEPNFPDSFLFISDVECLFFGDCERARRWRGMTGGGGSRGERDVAEGAQPVRGHGAQQ